MFFTGPQQLAKLVNVAVSAPRHISILRIFFAYLGTLTSLPMSSLKFTVPSLAELHTEVEKKFKVLPCIFQAHVALAQLEQKDCITISPTGSGKTLTFWIPLLFNNDRIIIIVTALNILGDKNVAELEKLDVSAANITGDSATDALFKVPLHFLLAYSR